MAARANLATLGPDALRQIDNVLFAEREREKLRAEKKAKAPRQSLEDELQAASNRFLSIALPADAWACHIPNGEKRAKATAGKLKAMGVKAGAPDWLIVWRGRAYFIELKAPKGQVSEAQRNTHAALRKSECRIAVCRSLTEIETTLRGWLIPLRASIQGIAA
jgi:hypothetical protein